MANDREVLSAPDVRIFIQRGGTRPGQKYEYLGCGETGDTELSIGEREVIRRQSREQRGKWDIVGKKYAQPDLHTTSVRLSMPRATASFLERMLKTRCGISIQAVIGKCSKPDEFHQWESKLLYEYAELTSLTIPGLASVDGGGNGTDEVFLNGPMQFEFFDRITRMRFTEKAADDVLAEVLDGMYAYSVECGECAPYSEGCDHLYLLTRAQAGSPGLSGQLVYTNDGESFTRVDIPTLGGLAANKIATVGDYLIVISEAARNHQYARRQHNIVAGDWIEVDSGYIVGAGPRALYVKSPGEVFVAGAIGYLYKADDYQTEVSAIESGVLTSEDFNGIDGDGGDVIVAVADNNVILLSLNNGESWELVTGPLAGSDLQSVAVLNESNWVIGGDGGAFYRTNDGGESWTAIPFKGSGVGAIVHSIRFSSETNSIGYAAIEIGGRGYVYRTTDGGTNWSREEPAITGLENNDRITFVAPCPNNINVVAAGGLAANGSDGFLAVAR
jgi:hypothetical protein